MILFSTDPREVLERPRIRSRDGLKYFFLREIAHNPLKSHDSVERMKVNYS
jgi:hypothetical protein